MKRLALATAATFLLAPALVHASQPTRHDLASPATAPDQAASAQSEDKPGEPATAQAPVASPTGTGEDGATCSASGKSSNGEARAHSSAKVGKDTGELPPPRKKASNDGSCASQPD